jgi:hypothetical protein
MPPWTLNGLGLAPADDELASILLGLQELARERNP